MTKYEVILVLETLNELCKSKNYEGVERVINNTLQVAKGQPKATRLNNEKSEE